MEGVGKMRCYNCGSIIPEGEDFCTACGTFIQPGMQRDETLNDRIIPGKGVAFQQNENTLKYARDLSITEYFKKVCPKDIKDQVLICFLCMYLAGVLCIILRFAAEDVFGNAKLDLALLGLIMIALSAMIQITLSKVLAIAVAAVSVLYTLYLVAETHGRVNKVILGFGFFVCASIFRVHDGYKKYKNGE